MTVDLGLTLDGSSWPLYAAMLGIWLWSLRLVPDLRKLGWQAVPVSLFGLVWLGFFLDFVMRFPILCWDSFTFGNMTSRLAEAAPEKVNLALILAGLYWLCVSLGFALASRIRAPSPLTGLSDFAGQNSGRPSLALAAIATICIILTSGFVNIPKSLFTPLGIMTSLWIIPASLAWWNHFHGASGHLSRHRWGLLLPGILHGILSPYRENFAQIFIAICIAAFYAGRRYRLARVAALGAFLFLAGTTLVGAYRQVLWQGKGAGEALAYAEAGHSFEKTSDAKWAEALRRFHAFDSLLLTTRFVPAIFPFSGRPIFLDSLVRGLVPRVFYANKAGSVRGTEFSMTIWGVGDDTSSPAAIAPSMPGDLFEAGGAVYVLLGGLGWGLCLGFLEGWKLKLPSRAAAAFTALLATHCAASVERDFGHMIAATLQLLIVLFLVTKFLAPKRLPRFVQPNISEMPPRPIA
ncbi:MAG: hypothetical protein NTY77_15290 [Elusimicrobia bacterium]|nr:hypothetical protein [Elusimicrobiota bacterium]